MHFAFLKVRYITHTQDVSLEEMLNIWMLRVSLITHTRKNKQYTRNNDTCIYKGKVVHLYVILEI